MADPESLDPTLLAAGQGDEESEFHQFRFAEVLVEVCPQVLIGDFGIPEDRTGVPERRLIPLREPVGILKLQEIVVVRLGESILSSLDRSLDPSIFTGDRFGNVDPTQLFDLMVEDSIKEGGAPCLGKGMQDRRYVRSDGLTFGARGAVGPSVLDDLPV